MRLPEYAREILDEDDADVADDRIYEIARANGLTREKLYAMAYDVKPWDNDSDEDDEEQEQDDE